MRQLQSGFNQEYHQFDDGLQLLLKFGKGLDENKILLVSQVNNQHSDITFDFQSLLIFNKQQCVLCRISHSKNVKS